MVPFPCSVCHGRSGKELSIVDLAKSLAAHPGSGSRSVEVKVMHCLTTRAVDVRLQLSTSNYRSLGLAIEVTAVMLFNPKSMARTVCLRT